MLQKIRENSQGWIAWVIVGLIIVTFALFGIDQYAQSEKTVVVAEVNGEEITGVEFLSFYSRQKQRLQTQFGDMYEQVVQDDVLREKVLDALIESKLISQYSSDGNMLISDVQLASLIQSSDIFHKDGKFDEATYNSILLRNGLSVARYEYEQRKFLTETQFKNLTASSVFSTESQQQDLAEIQYQQRQFNYLRVDQHPLAKMTKVSSDQVSEFYNMNKENYVVAEKVKVDYLLLSQKYIAKKVTVKDADLEAYFQDNQDQFTFAEQREARHILVRVDSPQQEEEALNKIKDIQAKITAGEDFGKLAKEYSDDTGSANVNGDLGKFQQGMMVPEFDKSVFSLSEGEVSEPVKTDFGYHLIKLTKIHPKYIKKYDDVKAEVEESYRNKEAEQLYFNLLDKLNTLTYEQPDTLESAASAIEVDIKTSAPFSKTGGEGVIESNPKVITAAFSEEVMKNKVNSSSIELSPTSSVVVRINEVIPARQKDLKEVATEIEQEIKKRAGKKASYDLAKEILAKVTLGDNLQSFVKAGVEFESKGWVERENNVVLPQLTRSLFKAPKPADGKSSFVISTLPTGDSVVIELLGVKKGKLPVSKEAVEQLKNTTKLIQSEAEIKARIDALLEKADISKRENYKLLKL